MKSRGFTLIEMLVATVLSAVLVGALLSVVSRLSQDRAQLAKTLTEDHSGVQSLLEWDLHNSEQIETISPERIDIMGHNAINPATLEPTFHAVSVSYELNAATHQLIRRQKLLDDPAAVADWQSIVANHVQHMILSDAISRSVRLQLELDNTTIEVVCQR